MAQDQNTILIVGGGASGLMAALSAATVLQENAIPGWVIVLERMDRVGKKLLATGNGRCNLSNLRVAPSSYNDPDFVEPALHACAVHDTLTLFESLGMMTTCQEEGRIYPYSLQASSVLDVLRLECVRLGVIFHLEFEVKAMVPTRRGFTVANATGTSFSADRVIIAGGGKAQASQGSNGSAHRLLQMLGHNITQLYPSLVQLQSDSLYPKQLKGIRVRGKASLSMNGQQVASETGEILFTDRGLSGIAIMQLSRDVEKALEAKQRVSVLLDLLPHFTRDEIMILLQKRRERDPKRDIGYFLTGLLHNRLGQILLHSTGISPDIGKADKLSDQDLHNIAAAFKKWEFNITGTMGFTQAQITAGGARVSEFEAKTLQSKRIPGLYACGEVLDIDAGCGGYNLQWAWSSGKLAGTAAALSLQGVLELAENS